MAAPDRCSVCSAELMLGGVKYRVNIKITSSFDGYLPEVNEESDEERKKQIEKLIESLDSMSAEDAEAEVFQEIDLVLCSACRRRFLKTISTLAGKDIPSKPKQATLLQ